MTRNRDDFSTAQAFRAATVGTFAILTVMGSLAMLTVETKSTSLDRATALSAASVAIRG